MNYAYYPGCSLESTSPDFHLSTKALIDFLQLGIDEIPDWTCCGASAIHPDNKLMSLALPSLTLDSANKVKKDIMVQCPACFAHLREAQHALQQDNETTENITEVVGKKVDPSLSIKHFSEILVQEYGLEKLKEKQTKSLEGLKVASYYGCVIVRPEKVMKYDDPENPMLMDQLIEVTGASSVDWPFKTKCCGAGNSISRTEIVLDLTYEILRMAKQNGAEAISVLCPLCHINLDLRQKAIEKRYKEKFNLPVFYYTQLLGLSFGLDPKKLALDRLFVSPFPLLRNKGLL
jgi:heterodisulfide reductase subunit B2